MKKFIQYSRVVTLLVLTLLLAGSCATRKRKGDVGGFKKFYHNVTAKYNGYFNANEIMKETFQNIEENHLENYSDILPVYPELEADPSSYKADMDKVIEKVTTVATIHDVSDYVDDCYVMMGHAQYIKQDYETAEETFEFFKEEFNPNDPSSRNYKKKAKSSDDIRKEREEERKEKAEQRKKEREAKAKEREEERKRKEEERKEKEREREKEKREQAQAKKKESKESRAARIKRQREEKLKARKAAIAAKDNKQDKKEDNSASKTTEQDLGKKIAEKDKPIINPAPKPKTKVAEDNAEEVEIPRREEDVKEEKSMYYDGMLLLGKIYIERQRYSSADFLLRQLWEKPEVSEKVKKEVPAARAYSKIKQKDYEAAKEFLAQAAEVADRKSDRARYAYILAQLEEKSGAFNRASQYYALSKKLGNSYEMELNAQLNMIKNEVYAGSQSFLQAEKELIDIRDEGKNLEFKDRISFVLAQLAMAAPDMVKAEEYLEEALRSGTNNNIKAEAYYTLADVNYQREDYLKAKSYYDSTLTVINKKDERKQVAEKLARNLSEIAKNINIIEETDSLLLIGALSEEERIAYAQKIVEDQAKMGNPESNIADGNQDDMNKKLIEAKKSRARNLVSSDFFAYDREKVKAGKEAFKQRWGNRSLQSNWRRRETIRNVSSIAERETQEEEVVEEEIDSENPAVKAILDNLPTDQIARKRANDRIANAMFQLGKLYRNKLENYSKSIETHEELLSRYPDFNEKLDAYYYIYLTALDIPDAVKASKYKGIIISQYPDSKYAKVLKDPAYAAALADKDRDLNAYYDDMFDAFNEGNYEEVESMLAAGEKKFGKGHNLRPKFGLLGAITKGKTEGEEGYIKALQDVIKRYPNTPEQTRAREILRFLKGDKNAFDAVDIDAVDEIFKVDDERLHYLAVVVYEATPENFDIAQLAVSDFNKKYHKSKRLQLADISLNRSELTSIILVRKFSNKTKAMEYYQDVIKKASLFMPNDDISYDIYPVTQSNYRKILDQKSTNKYRIWFEKNYLEKNQVDKK